MQTSTGQTTRIDPKAGKTVDLVTGTPELEIKASIITGGDHLLVKIVVPTIKLLWKKKMVQYRRMDNLSRRIR